VERPRQICAPEVLPNWCDWSTAVDTGRPDELTYCELREKLRMVFGFDDQQESSKQNFVLVVGDEEKHWPSCTKMFGD